MEWKSSKNFFSLTRNVIKLILDIEKLRNYYLINAHTEDEIKSVFEKEVVDFKTETHNTMINQSLQLRSKIRFKKLDILHSISKIFVGIYNLKIEPYYSYTHPFFISFCGLMKALVSFVKEYIKASDYSKMLGFSKSRGLAFSHNSSTLLMISDKKKTTKTIYKISDVLLDEIPNQIIFEDELYFNNYYIDFNKSYTIDHKNDYQNKKQSLKMSQNTLKFKKSVHNKTSSYWTSKEIK